MTCKGVELLVLVGLLVLLLVTCKGAELLVLVGLVVLFVYAGLSSCEDQDRPRGGAMPVETFIL